MDPPETKLFVSAGWPIHLAAHYNDVAKLLKSAFKTSDKITFASCSCGDAESPPKKWPALVRQLADDVRKSLSLSQYLGPSQCCLLKLKSNDGYHNLLIFGKCIPTSILGTKMGTPCSMSQNSTLIPKGLLCVVFDNKCLISVRHVDDSNHSLMLQSPICIVAVGAFRQHLEFTYSNIMKLFY